MLDQLRFYARHSFNDLRVNGQRTIFALLCIAAGVAAIVSLQTLGVMIDDSLTSSLQESNGGDMQVLPVDASGDQQRLEDARAAGLVEDSGASMFGGGRDEDASTFFSAAGYDQVRQWFQDNVPGSTVTARQVIAGGHGPLSAGSVTDLRSGQDEMFVTPYIVDVTRYPLYGTRESEDGVPLDELITGPGDIVISRNLADTLDARVGDALRVNGANTDFVLRGIVPSDSESGLENIGSSLFGYFYVDESAAPVFDAAELGIDRLYVRLDDPAQTERAAADFARAFPSLVTATTGDLEEQNSEVADILNQVITIMGLVSLLIGGIGIINTMQVVVSRRITEIAVLKTIGLDGRQVTLLFLAEAVLMGLIGSILGIGLGWLAAALFKGIAGAFVTQTLTLRITPEPALIGLVVGVVVTAIFGFLPTLAAGSVRPNLVLRPNDAIIPRNGRAQSLLALLAMLVALSVVAQALTGDLLTTDLLRQIAAATGAVLGLLSALLSSLLLTGPRRVMTLVLLPVGAALGYVMPALLILCATFVLVVILYALLWSLIWVVGQFFPAGKLVDLKVALRAMTAARGRGAATLLALVIGVFTLSLISMLATAVSDRLEDLLVNEAGGNVIAFAAGETNTVDQLQTSLDSAPGVNSYTVVGSYNVTLLELHDASTGAVIPYEELDARVQASDSLGPMAGHGRGNPLARATGTIDARSVDSNLPDVEFYAGRQLTPADAGQPVIVVPANNATLAAGFEVGDTLVFRLEGSDDTGPVDLALAIVGMVDRTGNQMALGVTAPNYAPSGVFPAFMPPDSVNAIIDVDPAHIADLREATAAMPGIFVMETRLLNDLVNRLINQFTSFPLLVASLALGVGGIVIANSVALATLERRREIGIMKAVGLQRWRVLNMLLLENGLMGLIGGLIGVGISSVILLGLMIGVFNGNLGNAIPYPTAFGLMLMCVGIALVAALVTAWGASGEKPLHVLRYE